MSSVRERLVGFHVEWSAAVGGDVEIVTVSELTLRVP